MFNSSCLQKICLCTVVNWLLGAMNTFQLQKWRRYVYTYEVGLVKLVMLDCRILDWLDDILLDELFV